jgi:hypothetical protein
MGSTAKLHAVPTLAQLAQLFPKRTVLGLEIWWPTTTSTVKPIESVGKLRF